MNSRNPGGTKEDSDCKYSNDAVTGTAYVDCALCAAVAGSQKQTPKLLLSPNDAKKVVKGTNKTKK